MTFYPPAYEHNYLFLLSVVEHEFVHSSQYYNNFRVFLSLLKKEGEAYLAQLQFVVDWGGNCATIDFVYQAGRANFDRPGVLALGWQTYKHPVGCSNRP